MTLIKIEGHAGHGYGDPRYREKTPPLDTKGELESP